MLQMPLKTRRLQTYAIPLLQIAAVGIVLVPKAASADQLCGRQFDSLSQLYADLHSEANSDANRGWRVIERSTNVTFVADRMVWTFARDSQPAFPAAACLQIVEIDNELRAIVQTKCEGARDACDAVAAKANGKDWSDLFSN